MPKTVNKKTITKTVKHARPNWLKKHSKKIIPILFVIVFVVIGVRVIGNQSTDAAISCNVYRLAPGAQQPIQEPKVTAAAGQTIIVDNRCNKRAANVIVYAKYNKNGVGSQTFWAQPGEVKAFRTIHYGKNIHIWVRYYDPNDTNFSYRKNIQ